ncbi:hypothetical protein HYALB_00002552 [Hymenoscyphus albidus]|uniref:DUF6604 domain-containing protein n=1 Tax=Hymenoscyphus albidus TaxID=595503 RepID=A0A9N9LSN2_9HELO|nr:hypothetical protein HYALB_00002552 [Hymenoscyphus albidus]
MELDPQMIDIYKRYKAGTSKVMAWLASKTPESMQDRFSNGSASSSGGRFKGKERAKHKAKSEKLSIAVANIPIISKVIASTAKTSVPDDIIQTLEDVIVARSACNKFYESQDFANQSTNLSNQKHRYLIQILSETLALLKPLSRSTATSTVPKEPDHDLKSGKHIGDLCNRFGFLEIEEPTSWTSTAVSNKSNKPIHDYEIKKTEEDTSFAIYCLFKDLTDIRHYIRQTWAEYREHCITFTTAASVTNTAIALFRRLTREFVSEFPQFEDHGAIINTAPRPPTIRIPRILRYTLQVGLESALGHCSAILPMKF